MTIMSCTELSVPLNPRGAPTLTPQHRALPFSPGTVGNQKHLTPHSPLMCPVNVYLRSKCFCRAGASSSQQSHTVPCHHAPGLLRWLTV